SMYGVTQQAGDVAMEPTVLGGAIAIGLVTSVTAAVIPARNAAAVDPVQALQKGKFQLLSAGQSRLRLVVGALLGSISVGCLALSGFRAGLYTALVLAIVVAVLLGPMLSRGLATAIRPALKAVSPVEGPLAAD